MIGAVFGGPAITTCLGEGKSLGSCLRQRLMDAGILSGPLRMIAEPMAPEQAAPAPEPEVQVADAPDATTAPSLEPRTAPAVEPGIAPSQVSPTLAPEGPVPDAPSIVTLLRVEPDGAVVVAGMAPPGATVEVWVNDQMMGSTVAEESGDWVFVPDARLGAGGAELTTRVAGSDLGPAQSFAIVIDEAHEAEPLVVASKPGEASSVLQGIARSTVPSDPATEPAIAAEPEPAAGEQPTPPPVQPSPETVVADMPLPPAPASAVTPPTIDAIEIDDSRDFFAGAGEEGATVRLYVDDTWVADAKVEGGRWLVEARDVLVSRAQRVRVDMLVPGTSDVVGRAEVNFVLDVPVAAVEPKVATAIPAPETVVGVEPNDTLSAATQTQPPPAGAAPAMAAPVESPTAATPTTPEPAPTTVAAASPEPSPPIVPQTATEPQSSVAAVPATVGNQPVMTPQTEVAVIAATPEVPPRSVTTPATPSVIDVVPPSDSSPPTELVAERQEPPILPVPSRGPVELTGDPDIPTMLAVPTGDGASETQRFAAGKVIIRRGDNLWTIARRAYGDGLKYTMIFDANDDQIRNPNQIYPGQVFDVPTEADVTE